MMVPCERSREERGHFMEHGCVHACAGTARGWWYTNHDLLFAAGATLWGRRRKHGAEIFFYMYYSGPNTNNRVEMRERRRACTDSPLFVRGTWQILGPKP